MSLVYEHHDTRDDWLFGRNNFIGASEAGSILGVGFQSKIDLWREKTGRSERKSLEKNEAVQYGSRAENPLRNLFLAKHPEFARQYRPYDYLYQSERPWLRATLDGEIYEYGRSDNRGILEIKTATCSSRADWAKWDGRVPDGYYAQICHQMLASGFNWAYLFAELTSGTSGVAELRQYYFNVRDCHKDMEYLLSEEEKFWECVQTDRMPSVPLRIGD